MESNKDLIILSETVQFSYILLTDFMKSESWDQNDITKIVSLALFRDAIETLDSIYVLSDHGLEGPASVSLRQFLEIQLSLTYIINDPKYMEQRARCYHVGAQTHQRNEIKKSLSKIGTDKANYLEKTELEKKLKIVETSLKQPSVQDTLIEWKRTKKKSNKNFEPKWHSLYNGPSSIVQLAKYIQANDKLYNSLAVMDPNQKKYYEIFYSILSREAHSYAALDRYIAVNPDRSLITLKPIRTSTESVLNGQFKISNVSGMMMQIMTHFIVKLFPEYTNNYFEFTKRITKLNT